MPCQRSAFIYIFQFKIPNENRDSITEATFHKNWHIKHYQHNQNIVEQKYYNNLFSWWERRPYRDSPLQPPRAWACGQSCLPGWYRRPFLAGNVPRPRARHVPPVEIEIVWFVEGNEQRSECGFEKRITEQQRVILLNWLNFHLNSHDDSDIKHV